MELRIEATGASKGQRCGMLLAGRTPDGAVYALETVVLECTPRSDGLRVGSSPCGDGAQILVRRRGLCDFVRTLPEALELLGLDDLSGATIVHKWGDS